MIDIPARPRGERWNHRLVQSDACRIRIISDNSDGPGPLAASREGEHAIPNDTLLLQQRKYFHPASFPSLESPNTTSRNIDEALTSWATAEFTNVGRGEGSGYAMYHVLSPCMLVLRRSTFAPPHPRPLAGITNTITNACFTACEPAHPVAQDSRDSFNPQKMGQSSGRHQRRRARCLSLITQRCRRT